MRGHMLGGTRRLNRHLQSGRRGSLEENLIWYEKGLTETQFPTLAVPYMIGGNGITISAAGDSLSNLYSKHKKYERGANGFRPVVITKSGRYQLKWKLTPYEINFDLQGNYIVGNVAHDVGVAGIMFYGAADPNKASAPLNTAGGWGTPEYYCGYNKNYLAGANGEIGEGFLPATWPYQSERTIYIGPVSNIGSLFSGTYVASLNSDSVTPVYFDISQKSPFPDLLVKHDGSGFSVKTNYTMPAIHFITYGSYDTGSVILVGKLWFERIGDSESEDIWEPKIL